MRCFRCAEESGDLQLIDAQPGGPGGLPSTAEASGDAWRVVVMCPKCFDELDPDMWTCEEHWMAMKPAVPYSKLPPCGRDDYETGHWNPETYAAFAPPGG